MGTLLTESRINTLFSNEYISALFIHIISIFIMTSLIAYYCFKKNINDFLFVLGIALSPALIIHQGYKTGNLDILFKFIESLSYKITFFFFAAKSIPSGKPVCLASNYCNISFHKF